MQKYLTKKNLIIILVIIIAIVALSIYIYQKQSNKYLSFVDPKLTNSELFDIESKIVNLENKIKEEQSSGDQGNADKKANIFKLHMELSSYYRLRGRLLDAKDVVNKAMKIEPDNISPYSELYVIEMARQNYQGAKSALDDAIRINPNSAQYWRWYIELTKDYLSGTPQQIDDLYKQAIEKSGNNTDIVTMYAYYLESKNDLVGAVAQWRKATQNNPSGSSAYEAEISRIQAKLK